MAAGLASGSGRVPIQAGFSPFAIGHRGLTFRGHLSADDRPGLMAGREVARRAPSARSAINVRQYVPVRLPAQMRILLNSTRTLPTLPSGSQFNSVELAEKIRLGNLELGENSCD